MRYAAKGHAADDALLLLIPLNLHYQLLQVHVVRFHILIMSFIGAHLLW